MNIGDTQSLKAIITQAVLEALKHEPFPLHTVPDVAGIFRVSPRTVLTWRKKGLIKARCHILSGRSFRWLFTHSEVLRFLDDHFPNDDDVKVYFGQGSEFNPKTSKIIQMQKIQAFRRLYARTHSRRRKPE